MGCGISKQRIIKVNPQVVSKASLANSEKKQLPINLSHGSHLRHSKTKNSTLLNPLSQDPRRRRMTIRVKKSFLYSKLIFKREDIEKIIKEHELKQKKVVENEAQKISNEKNIKISEQNYQITKNNYSYINPLSALKPPTPKNENLSLDGCSTPTNIVRKIEINPYRNSLLIKKFFVYQLKKLSLAQKSEKEVELKETPGSKPENTMNNIFSFSSPKVQKMSQNNLMSPYHTIFSTYSKLMSKEVYSITHLDDNNIQLNDYFIYKNQIIARGTTSEVYPCLNIKTNLYYACKIESKINLRNKINILKRLHSRYIVQVYEILETKLEIYIIMELVINNSLYDNLDKLDEFCIWKYFRNLVSAVEHCHDIARVAHLSISLHHCLIDEKDTLKLGNFSKGKILSSDEILVDPKDFTVSPPEIAFSKKVVEVNAKAVDVWLMGNVLYSLINEKSFIEDKDYCVDFIEVDWEPKLKDLLCLMLEGNPKKRITIEEIKTHPWITKDGEFPMPDLNEEALEYCYRIISEQMSEKKK